MAWPWQGSLWGGVLEEVQCLCSTLGYPGHEEMAGAIRGWLPGSVLGPLPYTPHHFPAKGRETEDKTLVSVSQVEVRSSDL